MDQVRHRYRYSGPVMEFDRLICSNWSGETVAVSEEKARSNLAYQFKKEAKRGDNARISLHGKLIELETVM